MCGDFQYEQVHGFCDKSYNWFDHKTHNKPLSNGVWDKYIAIQSNYSHQYKRPHIKIWHICFFCPRFSLSHAHYHANELNQYKCTEFNVTSQHATQWNHYALHKHNR